ncbi:hypothetical protein [Coleofasciculus sp. FACHB-64]|uniref:hypothetical protein n=1 Tax=Cyanophyceae TaxID=3028117 RepID=UPI00168694D3|nr:hypothetical protein [Coleofasciculus sp. FACHB-64]
MYLAIQYFIGLRLSRAIASNFFSSQLTSVSPSDCQHQPLIRRLRKNDPSAIQLNTQKSKRRSLRVKTELR